MATRGILIRYCTVRKQFETQYVHHDMYPEYALRKLATYNNLSKVMNLMEEGPLSVLNSHSEKCTKTENRGGNILYPSIKEIIKEEWEVEHFYFFYEVEGRWLEVDKTKYGRGS